MSGCCCWGTSSAGGPSSPLTCIHTWTGTHKTRTRDQVREVRLLDDGHRPTTCDVQTELAPLSLLDPHRMRL
jgi:hypothetical protein